MPEYKERENAYKLISEQKEKETGMYSKGRNTGLNIAKSIIHSKEQCPSADVVEVVRCKDCEHCCISTDPKTNISIQKCGYVGFNPIQSSQVSDDFYCGYGELKEREG